MTSLWKPSIATLVNYTCDSFIKLTPGFSRLSRLTLARACTHLTNSVEKETARSLAACGRPKLREKVLSARITTMTWLKAQTVFEKALHQGTKRKKRHRETKVIFVSSGGTRGGARGARPSFISTPNLSPKGRKKVFWRPVLRLDDRPSRPPFLKVWNQRWFL